MLLRGVAAAVCVIGIVALVSWPQLVAPWSHTKAIEALIAPDAQCPRMTDYTIQQDPHFYFDCASHTMWRLHPSVLRATTTRGGGIGRVGAAVGLVFVVAGLVAARALLLAGRPADADEGPAREVDQVDDPSAGDDALSVARAAER